MSKYINIAFAFLILFTFTVSGYYTKQDINDMAYVVAVGVDVRRKK